MSFIPITSGEITTGEPVSNSTQTKIKDNFDNHEERIAAVEEGSASVYGPIVFRVNGNYLALDSILKTTLNFNLTITGVRLIIDSAGTSGTTEVNLKYKRGGGSWTSVLTTNPSVLYSAGSDAISSNAILDSNEVGLQAGDLLRLDIISSQVKGRGFMVRVDFNKN